MPARPARPLQAVILAGGKGTRLHPLTLAAPKPMVHFHGKPFLQYLLELLRGQGLERALLLLGYMPEAIRDHFGDGRSLGMHLEYSVGDIGDETGERLRKARALLDPTFLLAYCDNYWPLDLEKMWESFCERGTPAQITVYRNGDGYSRSNLRLDGDGLVEVYDRSRSAPGLQGVDIGFALVRRAVVDSIPPGNSHFEGTVYPALAARRQLAGYRTDHRYYSVGDLRRLPLTEEFLRRRPAVILDRDGVLNVKPPRACYVTRTAEFRWIPGSIEAVRALKGAGYRVFIVSNQAGIARGVMTAADLDAVHASMEKDLGGAEGSSAIDAIRVCPHGWDDGCECRKPKPGMLYSLQREFHLDLSRVPFIGDDERDLEAGQAAGCPTTLVSEERPLLAVVEEILSGAGRPESPRTNPPRQPPAASRQPEPRTIGATYSS